MAPRHQVGSCPLIPPKAAANPGTGCTLVGRWSLSSFHGSVRSGGVIELNADGSYYGGPVGTDLSQSYSYDGAYVVEGSTFNLISSCGDGCAGSGVFDLSFQNGCALAFLGERASECTGARGVIEGMVALARQ